MGSGLGHYQAQRLRDGLMPYDLDNDGVMLNST